jgi:hypothetical protein
MTSLPKFRPTARLLNEPVQIRRPLVARMACRLATLIDGCGSRVRDELGRYRAKPNLGGYEAPGAEGT